MNWITVKSVNENVSGKPWLEVREQRSGERKGGSCRFIQKPGNWVCPVWAGFWVACGLRPQRKLVLHIFGCATGTSLVAGSSYSWRRKRLKATPCSGGETGHLPVAHALSWEHGFPWNCGFCTVRHTFLPSLSFPPWPWQLLRITCVPTQSLLCMSVMLWLPLSIVEVSAQGMLICFLDIGIFWTLFFSILFLFAGFLKSQVLYIISLESCIVFF